MTTDSSRIQELVARPNESLSVELKRWIDPDSPEGQQKIVRTVLALRNHGGGYLIVGFDNKTLQPDVEHAPKDAQSQFHIDKIQALVAKFSSELFEVAVEFPERDGQIYPVIVVPPGVRTPVAARSELKHSGGKLLISTNDVYVRSLCANNTPSTTRAGWKDWSTLVEVCFDNREADIGRFIRRHLGGVRPDMLREFAEAITAGTKAETSIEQRLTQYLCAGEQRFSDVLAERSIHLPEHGTWEVALLLLGEVPKHAANQEFLNLLDASNPDYTGWPVWLISRGFTDMAARPYVFDGVWEACIASTQPAPIDDLDFMRLDPQGQFFLRRALEDDMGRSRRAPKPLSTLDFGLPVIRTAEALAVGVAFAKAWDVTRKVLRWLLLSGGPGYKDALWIHGQTRGATSHTGGKHIKMR